MRISSYLSSDGNASFGVVTGEGIRDVGPGLRADYPDLRAVLAADAVPLLAAAAATAPLLEPAAVRFLPPVVNPDKILCVGLNYATHIAETGRERPSHPSIFTRYPGSLVGHGVPVERPFVSEKFDYEGELAGVIGRPGRHVPEAHAFEHVAGYTLFNDGSVRDWQRHTTQFWAGKSFSRSGAMGPWLVTADEIPDPARLHLKTRVNGAEVQSAGLDDLVFGVARLIAYLSTVIELLPGDVIATGTPGGVGLFRQPPLFLKAGDVVEVEVEGIGVLSNPVDDEAPVAAGAAAAA